MSNFQELKAGDRVAIYGHNRLERQTVKRVTKTLFTVGDGKRKFSRKTGYEHSSSAWSLSWAEVWTDKHAKEMADRKAELEERARLRRLIDFRWGALEPDQVSAAIAALEAAGVFPVAPATP